MIVHIMKVNYANLIDATLDELEKQFPSNDVLEMIRNTVDIFDGKGTSRDHILKTQAGYIALVSAILLVETISKNRDQS